MLLFVLCKFMPFQIKGEKNTVSERKLFYRQFMSIPPSDQGFWNYEDTVKNLEVNCDFRYNSLTATLTAKQSVCAFCQRVLL